MQPFPTLDTVLVRQLLSAQFPQWASLPLAPVVPGGWDNRTFRLGDALLVRLPSAEAYVEQVEKEQHWLPWLAPQLPLPIPAPVAQGLPDAGYPWPWSIYRWLRGEPASAASVADGVQFARDLAGFLRALHRVDSGKGPPPGPHNFFRGGPLQVYDTETRTAVEGLAGAIDAVEVLAVWDAALASASDAAPVWVHGDLARSNLLVEAGALCSVIDFGCTAVGDPACDLVIAWTFFDAPARQAFREALPLNPGCWARGRGWALWKAVITLAPLQVEARPRHEAWQVLHQVLADHVRADG